LVHHHLKDNGGFAGDWKEFLPMRLAKSSRRDDSPVNRRREGHSDMTQGNTYTTASVRCLSHGGFHRMVYREWGPAEAERVAVCVHGLTRNASDFDDLAGALAAKGWRVVCPDVVGRGDSDRLSDPAGYSVPQYATDMAVLIARLGVERVHWVGTSMGGLIGLVLAAQAKTPLASLMLNDIGPIVPKEALSAIADYVEDSPLLPDLAAAETLLRVRYAAAPPLPDEDWQRLARDSTRQVEGGFRLAYDPAIAVPFREATDVDIDLWPLWDQITCPTLVLRGVESPVLMAETASEMTKRGPAPRLVEVPGGHAPWLKSEDEISLLSDWLKAHF
jgi:pimeloyl-ACP methyl ester carboxylesterase